MAHKMLKFSSLLLYLLGVILSFLLGVSYAGFVEAGKGQMLAGGAIVLGYGVIGAVIGLACSLFIANKLDYKKVMKINLVAALMILGLIFYYKSKFDQRKAERESEDTPRISVPHGSDNKFEIQGLLFLE